MGYSCGHQHHAEQHRLGARAFDRKYQMDLRAMAAGFTRRSPDREMRASLKPTAIEVGSDFGLVPQPELP
jgi:hypothetical protein